MAQTTYPVESPGTAAAYSKARRRLPLVRSLDESQFFSDRLSPGNQSCDPLLEGRYLCDAIGERTSSIVGLC